MQNRRPCTNRPLFSAVAPVFWLMMAWLVPLNANAGVLTVNGLFSTNDQSMWKSGSNTSVNFNIPIVSDVGWGRRGDGRVTSTTSAVTSVSTPSVPIRNPKWTAWKAKKTLHQKFPNTAPAPGPEPAKTIVVPGEELGSFGGTIETASMARFGVDIKSEVSGGSIDVNLPVSATFSYSDEDLIAGQSFVLQSDYILGGDAQLTTVSPGGFADLILDADLDIDAGVDIYLGSDTPASIDLLQGFDANAGIPVLGLNAGEGLEFLSTPLEDVDEMLLSAGLQAAKFTAEKKIIAPESEASKTAQKELADANMQLVNAEAENKQIEREQEQAVRDVHRNDEDIAEADMAVTFYGDQISTNEARQQEIDHALAGDDLSSQERQALATERSGLDAQNKRLEQRQGAVQTYKEIKQADREEAIARVNDVNQRKAESDTKKSDLRSDRDDKLDDARDAIKDKNDKKKGGKYQIASAIPGIGGAVLDVIEADYSLPVVETFSGPVPVGEAQPVLTSSGEDQFVELLLGVDDLLTLAGKTGATALTGGAGAPVIFRLPGLSDEIELTDYVRAEYAILDLNIGARGYVTQSFEFTPTFEVSLDLGDGNPVVFDLGEAIEITLPESIDEFVLTPTIRLKNTITNTMGIRVEPVAELAAMGLVAGVEPPPELENQVDGFTFSAIGCIPIPSQQGGFHGGPGGSAGGTPDPHTCEDKYPMVGTIDGLDLVPEEYVLDTDLLELSPYSESWELGGFTEIVADSASVSVASVSSLPGGTFDVLADPWGFQGNVIVQDGAALLTTHSPVNLFSYIDTPEDPFQLLFDYRFGSHSEGWLSIFLDDVFLDAIQAFSSPGFSTNSVYVTDLALLGRSNLLLEFEYLDVTGSQLFLDNISTASRSSVPTPPSISVLLFGLLLLGRRIVAQLQANKASRQSRSLPVREHDHLGLELRESHHARL